MPIERVGFIGLGTMGAPMARNVMAGGFPLGVYDIRPEAAEPLAAEGATAHDSPAALAAASDAIISIVPDSQDVAAVMLGEGGVLPGARSGSLIIEMSTIDPETTRRVGAEAARVGVRMIDAPVCRSSQHAVRGELMVLVGGHEKDFEECLPLLKTMGDTFHYCGELGAGVTMKLVNNTMGQGIALAVLECLTLGVKAGLSLEQMVEVFSGTAVSNKFMEAVYPARAFRGNFDLGFALDWAHKDVGHFLSLASRLNVPCPAAAMAHQFQQIARSQGKGRLDHTVLLTVFEELSGVELRSDSLEPRSY